ncbi:hypothetical protein [Gorillibacterium timonense]|uniref:hypothetical protein n=1 Tax=Gorillibacterium timonense TaxID=1689269 RepID=UPI00071D1841|nr:hypothetical protein [Gorillibacterium timonense]
MKEELARYYELKGLVREAERELAGLRESLLRECEEQECSELFGEGYRLKLVHQERKEFDDRKLYEALPDAELWRLASKADPAKIASLLKLGAITEEQLKGTYASKEITLLTVERL